MVFISATMDKAALYNHFIPANNYDARFTRPSLEEVTFHMSNKINCQWKIKKMYLEDLEKVWKLKDNVTNAKRLVQKSAGGIPKLHPDTMALIFKSINKLVKPFICYVSIPEFAVPHVFIRIYIRDYCLDYRKGAILVTLPGVGEINRCRDHYNTIASKMKVKLRILVLHSKIGQIEIE